MDRYKVDELSDEFETTLVIATQPTWRDVWKIIRGTYKPQVEVVKKATWKGINRALREVWTDGALVEQLNAPSPLTAGLEPGEYGLVQNERTPEA